LKKSDYLDYIILETLNILHQSKNGLRYVDLRTKLNVSDTSLVNRLYKLKSLKYVELKPQISDTGKNYFAYTLTDTGIQLVKELDIEALLIKVEKTVNAKLC